MRHAVADRGLEGAQVAARKDRREIGAEAHDLVAGIVVQPHRRRFRRDPLEETHGLQELEALDVFLDQLSQSSCISPALGGHRFNTPSPGRVRATVCVNEFAVV